MSLSSLSGWVQSQIPAIETALRELVNINTHTNNQPGVDQGMAYVKALTTRLGFVTDPICERHLLIRSDGATQGPRILLIAHVDTVFAPEQGFLHYEPLDDGYVRGPGIGDMKGGLLIGLWAMHWLAVHHPGYDVQMVVSADEENGSPSIRQWYLGGHIGADLAIGLEPGFPQGELTPDVALGVVYQRRGYGAIRFKVYGQGCHSGTPHLGLNAIEAVAQRITRIHALSDPARNTSTTVGMIQGGISPNTVPGEVEATASFRFETRADGETLKAAIEEIILASYIENLELGLRDRAEFEVEAFIPPMERTPESQRVVDIVLEEARSLGQNVVPIARGGGSDANFVSATGTPSICGMGAPAQGIHTDQEKVYMPLLFARVELLARTLYRLARPVL